MISNYITEEHATESYKLSEDSVSVIPTVRTTNRAGKEEVKKVFASSNNVITSYAPKVNNEAQTKPKAPDTVGSK